MKNLIKHKVFIGTFLLTYFLFFSLTIFVFDFKTESGGVANYDYGFPFPYFHEHCFGGNYLWSGLLGNILFAAIISFVTGLVSTHFWLKLIVPLWQKVYSPEFRAKWYL